MLSLREPERSIVNIAVPDEASRIRTSNVACTIYVNGIPRNAFINLGNGVAISSPELLFVELAANMHPIEHLMLGHELCGTFCRNNQDPYNGPITYGVEPLTSVEKIGRFLRESKRIRGMEAARASLEYLNDNAWSPTESLVAALICLPSDKLGYDLGKLVLNPRVPPKRALPGMKSSRVPDIMIEGTPVGLNYDGLLHLDLNSIVKTAMDVGSHPEIAQTQTALDEAVAKVRAKALDDIRRNRELATDGLLVFPLLKEDLFTPNGLDLVVAQLISSIERTTNRTMTQQKRMLQSTSLNEARYRMMLSFLPGNHERNVQVGRFINGCKIYEGPGEVRECWIEL